MAIVVNGEAGARVQQAAANIAQRIWSDRERFVKRLTPMDEAIADAARAGRLGRPGIDTGGSRPRGQPPLNA